MKWQLVPVEPTEEMLREIHIDASFTGRAMQARYAAKPSCATPDRRGARPGPFAGGFRGQCIGPHDELQFSVCEVQPGGPVAKTYQLPEKPLWPRDFYVPAELAMPYDGTRYAKDAPSDLYKEVAAAVTVHVPLTIPGGLEWDQPETPKTEEL